METKINIAGILKNKPQGTKLYNLLYNINVELDTIITTGTKTIVWCTDKIGNTDVCHRFYSEFGTIEGYPDGLQILFPSKEMRNWSKFAWKRGDALSCGVDNLCIFEKWANKEYTEFYAKFVTPNYSGNTFKTEKWSKETNEAVIKQYISNIEEFKGGKLNLTTLEIEKTQPEFKDGDIVAVDLNRKIIRIFKEKKNENNICWGKYYIGFSFNNEGKLIQIFKNYTADCSSDRLATDSERQQLFSALEKEGKAWDAEKKEIVDLKPKCEFKPFDKVLVRCGKSDKWSIDFFSHKVSDGYICAGDTWFEYCLPYNDETAHLIGTTDEWEGGKHD